jgi:hypothetical protein
MPSERFQALLEASETPSLADAGLAALLVVDHETLAALLQLPKGSHIDAVHAPHDEPGTLHVRLRGAGWPTKMGWKLPQARGTVTRCYADNGEVMKTVIDWKLLA